MLQSPNGKWVAGVVGGTRPRPLAHTQRATRGRGGVGEVADLSVPLPGWQAPITQWRMRNWGWQSQLRAAREDGPDHTPGLGTVPEHEFCVLDL